MRLLDSHVCILVSIEVIALIVVEYEIVIVVLELIHYTNYYAHSIFININFNLSI